MRATFPALFALILLSCMHPSSARTLDFTTLRTGTYSQSVDFSAYAPAAGSTAATNRFEGRLKLSGNLSTRALVTNFNYLTSADLANARTLPVDFNFEFVQNGDALIPLRRGPIASSHPWWEFVLEPGRVWNETGDSGWSRASIPFALVQKNANCTHNGVLMFVFRNDGTVSRAAMQVSSETCLYLQINMWGLVAAEYWPGAVTGAAALVTAHTQEVAARLPTRPISALSTDVPGVTPSNFAIGASAARTRYGVFFNGIHYVSSCPTRHGNYPFCEVLDLPSFSAAKSMVGGAALMRMEKLYPGTAALQVNRAMGCPSSAWQGTSLLNLLDMATGHYDLAAYMADESATKKVDFFKALEHSVKLSFACNSYPRQINPGVTWVYHTSDTYLLGSLLNGVVREKAGRAAHDIFRDVVVTDVYTPLKLSATARVSRRSYDTAAQPFFGWGLVLHADDIAKTGRFFGADDGRINGTQVLDDALLDAAMQRNPKDGGLQPGTLTQYRYKNGFWARNLQSELSCSQQAWTPFMSGFGGITVAMFRNGAVWYNFADDGLNASIDFTAPAREATRLGAICP